MSEYPQHPDVPPRGRHARGPVPQDPASQPQRSFGAGRPASQAGDRAGAQPRPGQIPPAANAYRRPGAAPASQSARPQGGAAQPAQGRPQGARQTGPYRPQGAAWQAGQRRPQGVPGTQRPQGASGTYRPAQPAGGYRPAQPAAGRGPSAAPKKGGPWRVVFWVALVVFVIALAALGVIGFSYWQGQRAYDDIAEQAFSAPSDIEGTSLADLSVDWDALRAINPDVVGWIYVPGTVVNYPIVHTDDDSTYLTRDFNGNEGGSWLPTYGTIFLSAANTGDFSDPNNIVYGHHLNNGSMFACFADFADQATFDEHRTIYLLTPQGNYRLTTFSLMHVDENDPLAQTRFTDDAARVEYVQDKIDRSVVKADGIAAASDMGRTFAFATCDNVVSSKRYVLFASVTESTADASADPDAVQAVGEAAAETTGEAAGEASSGDAGEATA